MENENTETSYTEAQKRATQKWRTENREKYNKTCNDYYHRRMKDPILREEHNKRCLVNNRKYQERKRLAKKEAEFQKQNELTNSIKVVSINQTDESEASEA